MGKMVIKYPSVAQWESSLTTSMVNTTYTNTGHSLTGHIIRTGNTVTMNGVLTTGSNITSQLNTGVFSIPTGFMAINQLRFFATASSNTASYAFYVDNTNTVFARQQLSTNTSYQFTASWVTADTPPTS